MMYLLEFLVLDLTDSLHFFTLYIDEFTKFLCKCVFLLINLLTVMAIILWHCLYLEF